MLIDCAVTPSWAGTREWRLVAGRKESQVQNLEVLSIAIAWGALALMGAVTVLIVVSSFLETREQTRQEKAQTADERERRLREEWVLPDVQCRRQDGQAAGAAGAAGAAKGEQE
jgi:hypothetical protein